MSVPPDVVMLWVSDREVKLSSRLFVWMRWLSLVVLWTLVRSLVCVDAWPLVWPFEAVIGVDMCVIGDMVGFCLLKWSRNYQIKD